MLFFNYSAASISLERNYKIVDYIYLVVSKTYTAYIMRRHFLH